MKSTGKKLRFFHAIFAMERDLIVGGQAVMEGVMMRTPSAYAIACRKSDGTIVHTSEILPRWGDKYKVLNLPVLRGGATLIQSMGLGIKALNFSAKIHEQGIEAEKQAAISDGPSNTVFADGTLEPNLAKAPVRPFIPAATETSREKTSSFATAASIVFALAFNIFLFIIAPLALTNAAFIALGWAQAPVLADGSSWLSLLKSYVWEIKPASWIAFNLIDGLVRMSFFVTMIFTMSYLRDIRRVFEYHGAEHKTVFTWEKRLSLNVENAAQQRRQHPRCGTSFLMVVMLVAIVLFSVIKFDAFWLNLLVRIALMPLVAGLSYEVIRYAAKKESGAIFKLMTRPGIWLQNITTREPDAGQLEVAIAALNESLKLEPATEERFAIAA